MKLILLILLLTPTSMVFAQNMNDSLYQTVVNNDTIAIKYFIKKGADVNFVKQQGWMNLNLLITAVNNKNFEAANILLQNKADINWKDGFDATALMYAAGTGDIRIVQLLIDNGADIKHKDKQGNDAISTAKEGNNTAIVKLLKTKIKSIK